MQLKAGYNDRYGSAVSTFSNCYDFPIIIFVYRIDAEASVLKKKIDDFTKVIVPSDVANEAKMHNTATADLEVRVSSNI